jgi:hypothetical protein
MAFNKGFRPQSPDAGAQGFDNFVAQAAMLDATKLFTELRVKAGDEISGQEKLAAAQLRYAMVDEICQLARQSKNKKFEPAEIEDMNKMPLWQLRSELGFWFREAGITMIKDPPKINYFKVMEPYWIQVRANREHYIKAGTATNDNYKLIMFKESEASEDEKKNVKPENIIKIKKRSIANDDNITKDMELLDRVEEKIERESEGETEVGIIDNEHKEDET